MKRSIFILGVLVFCAVTPLAKRAHAEAAQDVHHIAPRITEAESLLEVGTRKKSSQPKRKRDLFTPEQTLKDAVTHLCDRGDFLTLFGEDFVDRVVSCGPMFASTPFGCVEPDEAADVLKQALHSAICDSLYLAKACGVKPMSQKKWVLSVGPFRVEIMAKPLKDRRVCVTWSINPRKGVRATSFQEILPVCFSCDEDAEDAEGRRPE